MKILLNQSPLQYLLLSITICLDKEKPEQPTLDSSGKNMITNCQSGGTYTTIKVVWRSKSTKDRFNDYSYVLRVAN